MKRRGCIEIKQHANKPNLRYKTLNLRILAPVQGYRRGYINVVCSRNRQYSPANDRTQTVAIVSIDLNKIVC